MAQKKEEPEAALSRKTLLRKEVSKDLSIQLLKK